MNITQIRVLYVRANGVCRTTEQDKKIRDATATLERLLRERSALRVPMSTEREALDIAVYESLGLGVTV